MGEFMRRPAKAVKRCDPPHAPIGTQYAQVQEPPRGSDNCGVGQGKPPDAPQLAAKLEFFHQGNSRHATNSFERGAAYEQSLISGDPAAKHQANAAFESRAS